jgi:hypothetical protein
MYVKARMALEQQQVSVLSYGPSFGSSGSRKDDGPNTKNSTRPPTKTRWVRVHYVSSNFLEYSHKP